jgi:hypothetical protein
MKAMKIRSTRGPHRPPIRLVVGFCLLNGLLTLAGCSYLETLSTQTTADNRIQLGSQDGMVYLARRALPDYACANGALLQCESIGGKSLCGCPR